MSPLSNLAATSASVAAGFGGFAVEAGIAEGPTYPQGVTAESVQLSDALERAALSELERRVLVRLVEALRRELGDAFDQDLFSLAHRAQEAREGADYEAIVPDPREAKGHVDGAAEFVTAVAAMLEAE
jgi:hypothetical protein